jgi:AraC-like DNA-binding protein
VHGSRRREQAQVLNPKHAQERITIGRADPPTELAWCVDYLWWVRWDTPEPFTQNLIPRPTIHVAAEMWEDEPRLLVHGVPTGLFERRLDGIGRTVAAAFRPGGFRPFLDGDVAGLVDRLVPAEQVVRVDDRSIARQLLDPAIPEEDAAHQLAAWLLSLEPQPDPIVARVAALVERAEADRTIVRAGQLADIAGVSNRTLQRWFRASVGVGPKWVVRRHRLLDVAAAANVDDEVGWAALAAELGYTDQSHLIRHFRAVVGESPARYAEKRGAL